MVCRYCQLLRGVRNGSHPNPWKFPDHALHLGRTIGTAQILKNIHSLFNTLRHWNRLPGCCFFVFMMVVLMLFMPMLMMVLMAASARFVARRSRHSFYFFHISTPPE